MTCFGLLVAEARCNGYGEFALLRHSWGGSHNPVLARCLEWIPFRWVGLLGGGCRTAWFFCGSGATRSTRGAMRWMVARDMTM